MDWCKLDIMVHKAKGLKNITLFGSMDPYAVVWIVKDDDFKQKGRLLARKTNIAKKGASSPVWNYPFEFNLLPSHNHYTLFCEIRHRGKLFDRKIGEVQVPLSRLLVVGREISYPVKISSSGKVMGEIVLSHVFSPTIFKSESEDENEDDYEDGNVGRRRNNEVAKADELDMRNDYTWYEDE